MSISARIKRDLLGRLRTGSQLPTELTLDALAQHYEVSYTPVRVAVSELVAEGFLLKGTNRRLMPAPQIAVDAFPVGDDERFTPLEPPRDLLKIIERDLVRISLQGQPVHVREEAAAQQYGISRSAMRNVLHRLAGAGLITHIPRRGWQVRPFRQEDMEPFLEIRELLELKALELAQPHIERHVIQDILDKNRLPNTDDESPQIDNSWHAYLIEKAGNPYISDFFERHGGYYAILFDWEDSDREAALETVRQHRSVLEAILRQDWASARSALSWHIRSNHPVLRSLPSRKGEQPQMEVTKSAPVEKWSQVPQSAEQDVYHV